MAENTLPNGVPFFLQSYYGLNSFPYANLQDQIQDSLSMYTRGAGGFQGNNIPKFNGQPGSDPNKTFGGGFALQQPNVGGGLLGKTAYQFNPFLGRGNGGGGGTGGNTGGGFPPVTPGTGPAGTPTPPGGFAPGSNMMRPPGPADGIAPPGPGTTRTLPGPMPTPTGGGTRGGTTAPTPTARTGLLGDPTSPASLFNPGGGETDVNAMVKYAMALPESQRGNYINAINQYALGKGGASNLGAALQGGMRAAQGAENFENWYATNVTNKQGSTLSADGLPAWLVSALGGK